MIRSLLSNKKLAACVMGLALAGFSLPTDAEAGRYRRVVRRAYRPAVVVAAPRVVVARPVRRVVYSTPVVAASPVVYSNTYVAPVVTTPVVTAPYVTVGGGAVNVAAPYVGVTVGW